MVDLLLDSDERRLLASLAARVFADSVRTEHELAASGLLGLAFSAEDGGTREADIGEFADLAIAWHAKGEAFAIETALLQAMLGGNLISASAHPARSTLIAQIFSGDARVASAVLEPRGRSNPEHCLATASPSGGGWRLDGLKTLVIGASKASHLVVSAAMEGAVGQAGLALFLVDPAAAGVSLCHYGLRDGTSASDLALDSVIVSDDALLLGAGDALPILRATLAGVRLCLAAEASGLLRAATQATARYVAERQQFGQPIGSFQVMQHKLADLASLTDQAEALVSSAALGVFEQDCFGQAHRIVAE